MVNGTQSAQTNPPKKLRRNGRSKTLPSRAKPRDGGLHGMSSLPREASKQQGSRRAEPISDIMSLVHDYIPKIPSFCRPLRQIIPPLKAAHPAQSTRHGSPTSSSHGRSFGAPQSEREANLGNISVSDELLKRPSSSISPLRY